jgi:hypothetical protein
MRTQDECRWKYETLVILAFVGRDPEMTVIAVFVSVLKGIYSVLKGLSSDSHIVSISPNFFLKIKSIMLKVNFCETFFWFYRTIC